MGPGLMSMLLWLENLAISTWVRESLWGFPIVQVLHAVGMGFVVGLITIVNLRLLGVVKGIPIFVLVRLLPLIWAAFILNAVTGVMMYMANATELSFDRIFLIKLALIAAGFVIAQLTRGQVRGGVSRWPEGVAPGRVKTLALASLLIWYAAIFAGRYTAFSVELGA